MNENRLNILADRIERFLDHAEQRFFPPLATPDWANAMAFVWHKHGEQRALVSVAHPHHIALEDLWGIDSQKERLEQNTRQFVFAQPANNILLTGSRGTGKSSLVKALLHKYSKDGLRLIEVDKSDLADLANIVTLVESRPERFIIFCDDLSFEEGETSYKALKSVLDGSVHGLSNNVLIYATSNRRHLMPEQMRENLEHTRHGGEIHPGETIEEKISLSDRFGLWISFYPMSQEDYLAAAMNWLAHFQLPADVIASAEREALQWALMRGSRNGRVASQFARHYAGAWQLNKQS